MRTAPHMRPFTYDSKSYVPLAGVTWTACPAKRVEALVITLSSSAMIRSKVDCDALEVEQGSHIVAPDASLNSPKYWFTVVPCATLSAPALMSRLAA